MGQFHRGGEVTTNPPDRTYLQLWNPKNSGVIAWIDWIEVSGDEQEFVIGVSLYGGMLPTPMHTFGQGLDPSRGNDPLAKCELRQEGFKDERPLGQLTAAKLGPITYTRPVKTGLAPGYGIVIRSQEPGRKLRVGFSWDEIKK